MSTVDDIENNSFIVGPSPFDDPDADIVIRTSDNVEFATYKLLLILASPFFKDTFRLPQPKDTEHSSNFPDAHLIDVAEESKTIERILRFCYPSPTEDPVLETLEDVVTMIEATQKFEMREIQSRVLKQLVSPRFLDSEPLRVFAIAARYKFEAEVRMGAKHTLRRPMLGKWIPELDCIPTSMYHRFLEYHRECSEAASAVTSIAQCPEWLRPDSVITQICRDNSRCRGLGVTLQFKPPLGTRNLDLDSSLSWAPTHNPSVWWLDYMKEMGTMLKDKPCRATVLETNLLEQKVVAMCAPCASRVLLDAGRFKNLFADEVEKATDKIVLNIQF